MSVDARDLRLPSPQGGTEGCGDLVEYLSTGLTLDFSKADFDAPQSAVVDDGRARLVLTDAANQSLHTGPTGKAGA